ncbi:MAG: sulfite exporter TauE/SafE family protein [Gammaproteobacteria bacterium]|nr:sulfite exporter TauE/SafE family protein [Gammaproteobacteria bacterium]NNM00174.1 sulfite exporter TauE/SafE family protein [Gammaproteobacteria bacterium]
MIELWQFALLLVAGIGAGFFNVVAGGGSLLTVPVMLFIGIPGPVANGTNRIAILAQNLTAILAFLRGGYSDFRLSVTLALASLPGAVAGALLGTRLDGVWFNRVVAIVMLAVLLLTASGIGTRPSATKTTAAPSRTRWWLGHLGMTVIGFWGGFIQLGVGFLFAPVLERTLGLDLVRVNMHKVFVIFTYTLAALAIFAAEVSLLWLVGLVLAVGNSIGGWLGATLSMRRGERFIRVVFNLILITFIIKLLLF